MSIKELGSNTDSDGDTELNEVEEVELEGSLTSGSDNWTCDELIPITLPIICRVPQKVVIFMRSVERVMNLQGMGSLEFGVFLKGNFNGGELYVDSDATFVPQQKVTGATIDFQEDPPDDSYNGVIHRHPTGCKFFSGTDSHHINRNFEFSLLYEGNNIIMGIINVTVNDIRIQLPLKIEVQYPVCDIGNPDMIATKIQKDTSYESSTTGRDYRDHGIVGLLTNGDDNGTIPFGDRESVVDSLGLDREDDETCTNPLYICKYCGEPNIINYWPFICDSCEESLVGDEDAELIVDMSELDEETQISALEKLSEVGEI